MDQGLLTQIAQPTNDVAAAYQARTTVDANQQAAVQKQQDAAMLKVFEFAGDGRSDEAKFYAQKNNLQVPDDIYQNADLAKGLSLAGKLYDKDPVAAQKFTMGWMQNRTGDLQARIAAAQQAAGVPIDPNDRDYQRKIAFELWKSKSLPPEQQKMTSRFEAGQNAYNDVMKSGLSDEKQALAARDQAVQFWDSQYANPTGLPGAPAAPGGAPAAAPGTAPAAAAPAAPGAPSPGLLQDISLPGFGSAPAVPAGAAFPGVPATGPAPPPGQGPLSVRNNNPGNLRAPGQTAGFQQFQTPQAGTEAMRNDLLAKISGASPAMQAKFGAGYQPTLANILQVYAPPNENNTANYVMFVSQKTGISPTQPLTPADIEKILPAMTEFEGGQPAARYFGGQQPQPVQAQNQPRVPSGLPQGSVMIGTSGGKPVYQAPNGERFIDDGNP